jgi:hypothetical protein
MRKRRRVKTVFEQAGFGKRDFEVTALVLGVVVATSSDADTRLKCDSALKGLRKLRTVVNRKNRLSK